MAAVLAPPWLAQVHRPQMGELRLRYLQRQRFYVSAVAVSLQGFFLGPLFPGVVVMVTKLLPRHPLGLRKYTDRKWENCGSATSKGSDKPYRGDMQMPGLHSLLHGVCFGSMACAPVLCVGRGSVFARLLSRRGKGGRERSLAKTLPRPTHRTGAQAIEPKQTPWSKT
jgi:hypothetical protein